MSSSHEDENFSHSYFFETYILNSVSSFTNIITRFKELMPVIRWQSKIIAKNVNSKLLFFILKFHNVTEIRFNLFKTVRSAFILEINRNYFRYLPYLCRSSYWSIHCFPFEHFLQRSTPKGRGQWHWFCLARNCSKIVATCEDQAGSFSLQEDGALG